MPSQTVVSKIASKYDRNIHNVVILGFAFHLIFVAFATTQSLSVLAVQTASFYTNSTHSHNIFIRNIGYYNLLLLYAFFTVSNIFAPSVISLIGPKISLFLASITYVIFVASYIYPLVYTLYITAVLNGIGAAVLWTAQGQLLLENSDEKTIDRNSGIFLAFMASNFVIGNLFVFLYLRSRENEENEENEQSNISAFDRYIIFSVLSFLGLIGVLLTLFIIPKRSTKYGEKRLNIKLISNNFLKGILDVFRLFLRVKTWLLIPMFYISGLMINLYSGGVYATCFGTTKAPNFRVRYAPLSLLLSGVGGIIGSVTFAINGRLPKRLTRKTLFLFALIVCSFAIILVYYNMPRDCNFPQAPKNALLNDGTLLKPSNLYLAFVCSVLLGFADSIFKSIIYTTIAVAYEKSMSAAIMSIYKLFESLALMLGFFYNPLLNLYWQLLIVEVVMVLSFFGYVCIELLVSKKRENELEESQIQLQVLPQEDIVFEKPLSL